MKEKQLKGKDLVSYLMVRFNYSLKDALKIAQEKNLITEQDAQELKSYLNLKG